MIHSLQQFSTPHRKTTAFPRTDGRTSAASRLEIVQFLYSDVRAHDPASPSGSQLAAHSWAARFPRVAASPVSSIRGERYNKGFQNCKGILHCEGDFFRLRLNKFSKIVQGMAGRLACVFIYSSNDTPSCGKSHKSHKSHKSTESHKRNGGKNPSSRRQKTYLFTPDGIAKKMSMRENCGKHEFAPKTQKFQSHSKLQIVIILRLCALA
jgi:hypothetical protein